MERQLSDGESTGALTGGGVSIYPLCKAQLVRQLCFLYFDHRQYRPSALSLGERNVAMGPGFHCHGGCLQNQWLQERKVMLTIVEERNS